MKLSSVIAGFCCLRSSAWRKLYAARLRRICDRPWRRIGSMAAATPVAANAPAVSAVLTKVRRFMATFSLVSKPLGVHHPLNFVVGDLRVGFRLHGPTGPALGQASHFIGIIEHLGER